MELSGVDLAAVSGRRSSTAAGRAILSAAVAGEDPALAERIREASGWRRSYPEYFTEVTRLEGRSSRAALGIAEAGLAEARRWSVYTEPGGEDRPVETALQRGPELTTVPVHGGGAAVTRLEIPYRGRLLHGAALLRQAEDWVRRGITEPSFAEVLEAVVQHPEWLDLRGRTFGLVGAGAAMGPLRSLLRWGATVAAVDIPRPGAWQRILELARDTAGTVLVPRRDGRSAAGDDLAEHAGADLLSETGAIADWLAGIDGPLVMGNYGYLDGAAFVRLTVAFDLLLTAVAERRDDVSLAYLATPSDVFLVPEDAVRMATRRYHARTPLQLAARAGNLASGGRWLRPNHRPEMQVDAEGARYGLVDAFILAQGQNYALAKRLQRWRVVVARDSGMLTSVHVAPPTRTASVHSNPEMELRQRLTGLLGLETFDAATSQALGAAVLVHDVNNPGAPANPATTLRHPHELFMFAANPGGRWRVPMEPNTTVPVLAAMDTVRTRVGASLGRVAGARRHRD